MSATVTGIVLPRRQLSQQGPLTSGGALAAIATPEARPRRYSLAATFGGPGAAVEALPGVYLLAFNSTCVSLARAGRRLAGAL